MKKYSVFALLLLLCSLYAAGQQLDVRDPLRRAILDRMRSEIGGPVDMRFVVKQLSVSGDRAYFCASAQTGDGAVKIDGKTVVYIRQLQRSAQGVWTTVASFDALVDSAAQASCRLAPPSSAAEASPARSGAAERQPAGADNTPRRGEAQPSAAAPDRLAMLAGLQAFQRALASADSAWLKAHIVFPLPGISDVLLQGTPDERSGDLSPQLFDQYVDRIVSQLKNLTRLGIDSAKGEVIPYRVNALTPQQLARQYFPDEQDGQFYYYDGGRKIAVDGVCDQTGFGDFADGTLLVFLGTDANQTLPGPSELCDGGILLRFRMQQGELMLAEIDYIG